MPHKDPERRRAYGREWMKRNAEKARQAMRRWRRSHPDEHAAEARAFHARHRDERLSQQADYRRRNPIVRVVRDQRRRARVLKADGSYSVEQWQTLVAAFGSLCAYCGARGPLEADHRTPLARGGSNWIENILPACAPCNRRKSTMTEQEYRMRLAAEKGRTL